MLIDDCYVRDTSPGFHFTNTVLGAIFAISCLPQRTGSRFEYFQKPMEEVSYLLLFFFESMTFLHQENELIDIFSP